MWGGGEQGEASPRGAAADPYTLPMLFASGKDLPYDAGKYDLPRAAGREPLPCCVPLPPLLLLEGGLGSTLDDG